MLQNQIILPPMSPMYQKLWDFMIYAVEMNTPNNVLPLIHYQIVDRRNAIALDRRQNVIWHHICHPRKLSKAIQDGTVNINQPWWEISLSYAYFNKRSNFAYCTRCRADLGRTGRNMLKMAVLGMKIK